MTSQPLKRRHPKNNPPLPRDISDTAEGARVARPRLARARRVLPLISVTALPVLITRELWAALWSGARSQAWDGSGHHALAQLYSATIFPDTFGWTHAYFGGMGFPNFYPPLFYWLVALLHHTHLVSFTTAFKIILMLPPLLLPAAIWTLAWRVSNKDRLVATGAAFAMLPLLIDYRFFNTTGLMGLSYPSTFLLGLYTQTLGFVLLIAWYVIYTKAHEQLWRFALAAVLLALALLANVFSATTAAAFVLATIIYDVVRLRSAADSATRQRMRRTLAAHLLSPLVAGCLTLFWLLPLFNSYDYVVTRPLSIPFDQLVPTVMWAWYVPATIGILLWLRGPSTEVWPYLAACLLLAGGVFFAATIAPRWFPLQPPRLISTLNFLLAVPVGHAVAAGLQWVAAQFGLTAGRHQQKGSGRTARREGGTLQRAPIMIAAALTLLVGVLLVIGWITPPSYKPAFYATADHERIDPVLQFARQHRDGRYMVEVPPFSDVEAALDGRAINSYLGAQGNQALSLFFREGAPSVLFLNPLANAFSTQQDVYAISSVLADDLDFARQLLASHLERARFFNIKYLVMRSPQMKNRLEGERSVKAKYDFGGWSVFELGGEQPPHVRALVYKPALVVSNFSLKQRRSNQYDFMRFVEEQFADGWFDVILARSPETKIDRLGALDGFGALLLDTYEHDDEERAYGRLREWAQQRPLLLLASESALFRRIQRSIADFPHAEVIERQREAPGAWLDSDVPTTSYGTSSIRRVWHSIRRTLDRRKIATNSDTAAPPTSRVGQNTITIDHHAASAEKVPVLVSTTYHPNWQRTDGEAVYAATPFYMLTFVDRPTKLTFARRSTDRLGAAVSAGTLLLLCCFTAWHYRPRAALDERKVERNESPTARSRHKVAGM